MKYLRKFNESTDITNNIKEDIDDILLELSDNGFHIMNAKKSGGYWHKAVEKEVYHLTISKINVKWSKYEPYEYSEISEVVDRLVRYLGDNLLSKNITLYGNRLAIKPRKDTSLTNLEISYYI